MSDDDRFLAELDEEMENGRQSTVIDDLFDALKDFMRPRGGGGPGVAK